MKKIRKFLLVSLTIFFVSSCNSIKFSPDFYKNSSREQAIVSERGDRIYCDDIRFDDFASMHKEKIKELARILKKAKLPPGEQKQLEKEVNQLLFRMKED